MDIERIPGLVFLDTNIFVYSFDETAPAKRKAAQALISGLLRSQRSIISSQVVQEFLAVALRKFARPLTVSEARDYLRSVLVPICRHYPSMSFYDRALLLKEETGYRFYDSLIIAAAVETGCSAVLSEDLQDGRIVHGVQIVNPFKV